MIIEIIRDQVPVIPNFAMTDYGSQGRTRPNNVVDLQNCKNHQSVYTCLSRGSTLEGTIIVQSFHTDKLKCGIPGSLRQEFRELELLDEITKLRYLGKSSAEVTGIARGELIHSFRKWKGEKFVPKMVHPSIEWSLLNPFPIDDITSTSPWKIINAPGKKTKTLPPTDEYPNHSSNNTTSNFIPAKGTQALANVSNQPGKVCNKRKRDEEAELLISTKPKKIRVSKPPPGKSVKGFLWDSENWSCAYDSLLTILFAAYTDSKQYWTDNVVQQYKTLQVVKAAFEKISLSPSQICMMQARDNIRLVLGSRQSELGSQGKQGTDLYTLARELLGVNEDIVSIEYHCRACDYQSEAEGSDDVCWTFTQEVWKNHPAKLGTYKGKTVQQWLHAAHIQKSTVLCTQCQRPLQRVTKYDDAPYFMTCITHDVKVNIETEVKLTELNATYRLCGIVYYGNFHFVCRVIDQSGDVWYHDGAKHKDQAAYVGNIVNLNLKKLQTVEDYTMCLLIYIKLSSQASN